MLFKIYSNSHNVSLQRSHILHSEFRAVPHLFLTKERKAAEARFEAKCLFWNTGLFPPFRCHYLHLALKVAFSGTQFYPVLVTKHNVRHWIMAVVWLVWIRIFQKVSSSQSFWPHCTNLLWGCTESEGMSSLYCALPVVLKFLAEVTPATTWNGKFLLMSQFLDRNKTSLAYDTITLIRLTKMKHHGWSWEKQQ